MTKLINSPKTNSNQEPQPEWFHKAIIIPYISMTTFRILYIVFTISTVLGLFGNHEQGRLQLKMLPRVRFETPDPQMRQNAFVVGLCQAAYSALPNPCWIWGFGRAL